MLVVLVLWCVVMGRGCVVVLTVVVRMVMLVAFELRCVVGSPVRVVRAYAVAACAGAAIMYDRTERWPHAEVLCAGDKETQRGSGVVLRTSEDSQSGTQSCGVNLSVCVVVRSEQWRGPVH